MEENNVQSTIVNLNNLSNVNEAVLTPPVSDIPVTANLNQIDSSGVVNIAQQIPTSVGNMNLSGVVQPISGPVIATQPVQADTISVNIPAQTIVAQQIPAQQINIQPEVNTNNVVTHAVVEKKEILKPISDLRINIESMKAIMANTEKAIVPNPRIALSTVTQLKFTKQGLNVIASDNNVYIYQNDNHYSYSQEISIGVDTLLFKALVDKINAKEFIVEYNPENRTIKLKIEDISEYILQEQYARESEEAIDIELPQDMLTIPCRPLEKISEIQTILKSISMYASESDTHAEAYGVFIEPKSISANDTDNMCIRDNNIEAFKDVTLFLSLPLVKILKSINLGDSGEIGFKVDEGRTTISRLIIKTDDVILIAPVNEEENYQDYQLEGLKSFSNNTYSNVFRIDKTALLEALDRLSLFVEENDSNAVNFNFKPGYLELESTKNNGKERIKIPECNTTLVTKKIDVRKVLNTLKSFSDKDIQIKIDDTIDNMISLKTEDLTITMSVVD